MTDPSRVLVVSHDVVGQRMAGPAIRCWEFARALQPHCQVTLAAPNQPDGPLPDGVAFRKYEYSGPGVREAAENQDVLVLSGLTLSSYPFLATMNIPIVLDVYDPFNLENLQFLSYREAESRGADHNHVLALLTHQLLHADFFLCASEKQRDYWLGLLSALNRVNPLTYADDSTLRRLIDVVPFGVPDAPPVQARPVLKGVYPGIGPTDRVILWGGGVYNWFDPLTLIRAIAELAPTRPDVKLFFMGIRHPNPFVRGFEMIEQAIALSQDLHVYQRQVFFNDWVAYDERVNYLLEADVGVSLHMDHLETRFSFRTRILDYLWAGLPTIATRGDAMADLIHEHGLGQVVAPGDVAAVREALVEMLDRPDLKADLRPRFQAATRQLTWPMVTRPLLRFCQSSRLAADRSPQGEPIYQPPLVAPGQPPPVRPATWGQRLARGWQLARQQGPGALWTEVKGFVRWQLSG
ncbi:MAG: glycosyltransferase [Chloroflexi bacterium]|nr:glycosyltransferase [Chloroflexota bacterium]MBU1750006.1 glycosyltransferase [Chloroflexota bacterium]